MQDVLDFGSERVIVLGDFVSETGQAVLDNLRLLGNRRLNLFLMLIHIQELGVVVERVELLVVLFEEHLPHFLILGDKGVYHL